MNHLKEISNLKKYIVDPIKINLNKKLEAYYYHDISNESNLITNYSGVDIISSQLELIFEENKSIYISWATIDGWVQYNLCVSENSFFKGIDCYTKHDQFWNEIIGEKLKDFQVYGYKENVITITESFSAKTTNKTHYYEPHLLILYFENDKVLGISNFYMDDDFDPKLPMGDDIWIIFGMKFINCYIEKLSLDNLGV